MPYHAEIRIVVAIMTKAIESRKPVHKLGETIHSLLGWKSHLTSNWAKSVCDIMKSASPEVSSVELNPIDKTNNESRRSIAKIKDEIDVFTDYMTQLNAQRRQILNEFLDLRGNIRVFCRIRPIASGENFGQLRPVAALDSNNVLLKLAENKSKTYNFDKVFHPGSSQDEVFAEVEPVIKSALDGYNACIFAYGQTCTGKSFTMEGTPNTPGVVSRAMEAIFKQAVDSNHVFAFSFSMLEIYLGNLKDLLVPQPTKAMDLMPPCLSIQTDPKGGIEIDNLVAIRVTDFNQALRLYRLGCRYRSTASTNSNTTSSRSHCLIRLSITCFNAPERRREANKIWFIDLGGSERVLKTKALGKRLDEGKAINLSLSALGDVIHALQKKNSHVPYRNSKLTQVLKDSLGEDSKTLMLVHISPKEDDLCETVCSLNFATRVRSIHLGNNETTKEKERREIAITNLQQKMKMIEDERRDVRRNIDKLNEELEKLTGRPQSSKEELDASNLLKQDNLETKKSTSTDIKSQIPRFMKATVCSTTRKSAVDYRTFEERVKFNASRRRRPLSHRAESMSFPVKRRSENNSECSISRNSCLVDLNVKSNADDETAYSHDATTECDIKSVILPKSETSTKSSVHHKGFLGKGKKNSFRSTNVLKVDNWLRLHKNEPTISTISQKSKRVLVIPMPEKKQTRRGEREGNLRNVYENNYQLARIRNNANGKKLEKISGAVEFGKSKPETNMEVDDDETMLQTRSFVNEALMEEEICGSSPPTEIYCRSFDSDQDDGIRSLVDEVTMSDKKHGYDLPENCCIRSFDLNQDDGQENNPVMLKEKGLQCSDCTSVDDDEWCVFSCSDGLSQNSDELLEFSPDKLADATFDTGEDSSSSPSIPSKISIDTVESIPGIHNKRVQRALFMGDQNEEDTTMPQSQSPESDKISGIYHLIVEKLRIVWVSALLAIGFQHLGLDHEFFHGLTL